MNEVNGEDLYIPRVVRVEAGALPVPDPGRDPGWMERRVTGWMERWAVRILVLVLGTVMLVILFARLVAAPATAVLTTAKPGLGLVKSVLEGRGRREAGAG